MSGSNTVMIKFNVTRKAFGFDKFFMVTLRGFHIELFAIEHSSTVKYTQLTADEVEDLMIVGIRVYLMEGVGNQVMGFAETLWFFADSIWN